MFGGSESSSAQSIGGGVTTNIDGVQISRGGGYGYALAFIFGGLIALWATKKG